MLFTAEDAENCVSRHGPKEQAADRLNGARPGGAKGIGKVYAQHYSWRSPTTPTGEERSSQVDKFGDCSGGLPHLV